MTLDHLREIALISLSQAQRSTTMQIINTAHDFMSYKQHSLKPVQLRTIIKALPGVVDLGESGDGKCKHTWCFLADGQQCAIWDYKGARWSGYGPAAVFTALNLL